MYVHICSHDDITTVPQQKNEVKNLSFNAQFTKLGNIICNKKLSKLVHLLTDFDHINSQVNGTFDFYKSWLDLLVVSAVVLVAPMEAWKTDK